MTRSESRPALSLRHAALREDTALLTEISGQAGQAALARFFERHKKPAYGFALRLTGSAQEAEDVLQESLLVVWKRAATFRGEGSARSWFLRIVAHKAMQRIRGESRALRRTRIAAQTAVVRGEVSLGTDEVRAEGDELSGLLRQALDKLPILEQRLITLHFGAEMRIAEISRCCAMPRQTVKFRLEFALSALRSTLTKAGVNSAPAHAWPALLCQALQDGAELPAGLGTQIWCGRTPRIAPGRRASVLAKGAVLAGAGCVLVLTGLVLLESEIRKQGPGADSAPTLPLSDLKTPASRTDGPSVVPTGGSFSHRYSFADSHHTRFPQIFSAAPAPWKWLPPSGHRPGALTVGPQEQLHCLLPVRIPSQPVLLELQLRVPQHWLARGQHPLKSWTVGAYRAQEQSTPPYRLFLNAKVFDLRKNSLAIQVYLLEQYDVGLWDRDSVYYVHEYEQPYSGDRVYLEFRNFDVETITIRALDTAEIPARIRDRQALIQATGAAVLAVPRKPYSLVTGTGDWTPGR